MVSSLNTTRDHLLPLERPYKQTGYGNRTEYNSGSNGASDFKSAESVAQSWFELYDPKSNYQLIVNSKMRETL